MPKVYIQKKHHKQETNFSCVPACLKMMLDFFGINLPESNLILTLKTKPYGTHIINILNINNEKYEIYSAIEFWSLDELLAYLKKNRTPCIVPVWTDFLDYWDSECLHSVVVHGYDEKNILINDPFFEKKEFVVPIDDFINAWQINDGLAIIFKKHKMEI